MNRFKIEWQCRRGMRELDKLIMPFYQSYFELLNQAEQKTFVDMLDYSDPELFRWFMNQQVAPSAELQAMVELIRSKLSI